MGVFYYQHILVLVFGIFGIFQSSFAQKKEELDTVNRVKVQYAEENIIEIIGRNTYKYLYGNVNLVHDTIKLQADTATLLNDSRAHVIGNVVILQGDSLKIFSEDATYNGVEKIAVLKKDVVLENINRRLFTDSLIYDMRLKKAYYFERSLLTDEDAQLSSRIGIYDVDNEVIVFKDSVLLIHPEFELHTDSLMYDMKRNIAHFLGPTIIHQKNAKIYTEGGFYDLTNGIAEFNKKPQYTEGEKILVSNIMRYESKNNMTYLIEDVIYIKNDVRVESQRIEYNDSTKIADIMQDVTYHSNQSQAKGDRIIYHTDTDTYISRGSTHILDGTKVIDADSIDFNNKTGVGFLTKNVSIRDTTEGFHILGESIHISRKTKEAKTSDGRPLMILGKRGEDTLNISAEQIWTYEEITLDSTKNRHDTIRIIIADNDVRIYGKQLQGSCDSLVITSKDSSIIFYQNPIIWTDTIQYRADTIRIETKNGEIDHLNLSQKATIISTSDSIFFNQISGRKIEAQFDNGNLSWIFINGNATSIVYLTENKNEYIGVDYAISAYIKVLFKEGKLEGIKYFDDYSGELLPIEKTDHEAIKVKNFSWEIEKKPQSIENLTGKTPVYQLYKSMYNL